MIRALQAIVFDFAGVADMSQLVDDKSRRYEERSGRGGLESLTLSVLDMLCAEPTRADRSLRRVRP